MSQYEITFLLSKEEELKNLKELFLSHSAKIIEENKWGKKTLSYPIKKNHSAFYYNYKFEIEPSELKEFKKKLNFSDNIIRYLLLAIR